MIKISQDDQALLDSCCCFCLEPTVLTTGDYRWCEMHRFRGELLAWGMAHDYPALECFPHAIMQGAYGWVIVATVGTEDMVYILQAGIEMQGDDAA